MSERPQDRYNKAKTTTVLLRLNKSTDADIIERLEQEKNKTGYIKSLIRVDIERRKQMFAYFCDCCGKKFKSEIPERNENGMLNNICCPTCGAWDVYPDTPEEAAASATRETEYENTLIMLEDE